MGTFFRIAYFVVGLVQLFAVWAGAEVFAGKFLGFFLALLLTYIPLLGSALGVYGAVNAWDWPLLKACILFFWYVPLFLIGIGASFLADRR